MMFIFSYSMHFRVKIIDDDDVGYNANQNMDESDVFATNEEAPQIVGIIDERAPDVIMKQEYLESGKWKKLGNSEAKAKTAIERQSISSDRSPPRKRKDSPDNSPPRKRRSSSDQSPPRRNEFFNKSPARRRDSSDVSPPRRSRKERVYSPKRRSDRSPENSKRRRASPDQSPPRKSRKSPARWEKRRNSSDASPPRRSRKSPEIKHERDNSPPRRSRQRSNSPSRKRRSRWSPAVKQEPASPRRQETIKNNSPPRSSKMTKTLDGKLSGLQDAKTLKRENDEYKERQDKLFREMRPEMSGRHADIMIRDRRGKNKEFELDMEGERKKAELEEARKKEYDRWGKGLKQIEDLEQRYKEHMHEANKPLARFADDEDLQDHLRHQERLDDPMLEYMRRKKQDVNKEKGVEEKPKYQGQFLENRFNIRPGYRWDGVDRSNGYEKKYYSMISSKKSMEEEAYRYATEDM